MLYLLTERFPTNFLKRYPRQYLARLLLQSTFKYQEYQKIIFNLLSFTFNVICFSETQFDGLTLSENTSYELLNYQAQGNRKGGGVSIYVHISLNFKIRSNLSISINDIESLFTEIIFDKIRNAIGNVLYSSAVVQLNLLDHDTNIKVQSFLKLVYQNVMVLTINKSTRVTRKTTTEINHILTNCFCYF